MDHDVSTYEYTASTTQDNVNLPNGIPSITAFEVWGNGYPSYTLQDQMAWLSSNGGVLPTTEYSGLMPHLYADPSVNDVHQDSTSQCLQSAELNSSTRFTSQSYENTEPSGAALQTLHVAIPLGGNPVERSQSACTGLESTTSSNRSRSSSDIDISSPVGRAPKFKVPAIRTQFESKGQPISLDNTPLGDGFQVAPDTDGMTALSSEWMEVHDTSAQIALHDPSLSAASIKANSALLEPFLWESPITRRTSMSSAASGPVFSPYGTPASAVWQQSAITSPYSQYSGTPVSAVSRFSPQSPHQPRTYGTWNRAQYFNALRQNRNGNKSAMSLPSRKPPPMRRNITDSYLGSQSTPASHSRVRANLGAGTDSISQPTSATSQQLALPDFGTIFTSPDTASTEFLPSDEVQTPMRNILPSSAIQTPMAAPLTSQKLGLTPGFNSLNMSTPYGGNQPFSHLPTNVTSAPADVTPIPTPAHQPPLPIPSEPPLSDFLVNTNTAAGTSTSHDGHSHSHPPACGPIRQSPHFEGDIYTPRYKRRNAQGKWEGWCGYCQPGRWLDLKNSRFWEDKLRNHGICARTKTFFDGPARVRWVSDRGTVWEGEAGDSGFDLTGQEGIEDDGVGQKREGLCGECKQWVGMDGMRSRGKGRCVAWWMHAYKCHEQSRSRIDGT